MGIKGIYGEIGSGRRVALARLCADKLHETGRPLRIAIDISIWLFQIQASTGGANPELRTLYYRLVRLLSLNIQPLFVFDGPNKPPFKRNAKTSTASRASTREARRLLDLFAFPHWTAPGEAEAECAVLQRNRLVDYVLSEDVDTLAFGCRATMRNWSGLSERGNKTPTHVNVFEASEIKAGKTKLDREGIVLVALMSGGDYIPAGIPRCGIKIACEAARTGFGHDLCKIDPDDEIGFTEWKERLWYELQTNESGHFRTRHKALQIPETFPDRNVLGYHARPDVSSPEDIRALKDRLRWTEEIDIKGLRDFVDEEFQWKHLSGAKKFLRNLAPALLAHKLYQQAESRSPDQNLEEQTEREERLILSLTSRRQHLSTDLIPEVKVTFIPGNIVGLDLDSESADEQEDSEDSSGDDVEEEHGRRSRSRSPVKKSRLTQYDPWEPAQAWVMEKIVSLGAPLSFERWETERSNPKSNASGKVRGGAVASGMRQGALESYLRVTKPTFGSQGVSSTQSFDSSNPYDLKARRNAASSVQMVGQSQHKVTAKPATKKSSKTRPKIVGNTSSDKKFVNPWTLARKTSEPSLARSEQELSHVMQSSSALDEQWYSGQYEPDGVISSQTMEVRTTTGGKPTTTSPFKPRQPRMIARDSMAVNAGASSHGSVHYQNVEETHMEAVNNSVIASAKPQTIDLTELSPGPASPVISVGVGSTTDYPCTLVDRTVKPLKKHASVVIRESLEGTWKALEDHDDLSFNTRRHFSDVDVLDLT